MLLAMAWSFGHPECFWLFGECSIATDKTEAIRMTVQSFVVTMSWWHHFARAYRVYKKVPAATLVCSVVFRRLSPIEVTSLGTCTRFGVNILPQLGYPFCYIENLMSECQTVTCLARWLFYKYFIVSSSQTAPDLGYVYQSPPTQLLRITFKA